MVFESTKNFMEVNQAGMDEFRVSMITPATIRNNETGRKAMGIAPGETNQDKCDYIIRLMKKGSGSTRNRLNQAYNIMLANQMEEQNTLGTERQDLTQTEKISVDPLVDRLSKFKPLSFDQHTRLTNLLNEIASEKGIEDIRQTVLAYDKVNLARGFEIPAGPIAERLRSFGPLTPEQHQKLANLLNQIAREQNEGKLDSPPSGSEQVF